jgi:hypothetical protein
MGRGKGHQKHSGGNPDHPQGGPPGHRKDSEAVAGTLPAVERAIETLLGDDSPAVLGRGVLRQP